MPTDRTSNLEAWWTGLSEPQQVRLLPLGEGDELPPGHVIGLTNALGVGPVGSKWEHDGYPFRVSRRLSIFLQQKAADHMTRRAWT
jgi:hypothetical protein